MITIEEYEARFGAPAGVPAATPAAAPAALGLLNGLLLIAILISPLVFIEPAPYEFAVALLGFGCILARYPLDRRILPLVVLLIIWNLGGALALTKVLDQDKTVRYTLISLFMAFSAVVFACLFARGTMSHLKIMRRAYIVAAMAASVIGCIGYFNLFPGAAEKFASIGRANSTFKDPNVFGPFLILPLLMLSYSLLMERLRLRQVVAFVVILFGLLLSFSRGAWAHFAVSAAVMVIFMFVTAPDLRTRARLMLLMALTLGTLAVLFAFALSFESIGGMFKERAQLIQSYDAGSSMGRFNLQQLAIGSLLDNPFGLGPYGFVQLFGLQQHNTYLQSFLVYGWAGGFAYAVLILLTLAVGLRAALTRAHWQPYAIAALAAFIGEVVEGFVIDTDHWRHFFLLLGIIWGLHAAAVRHHARGVPPHHA